MTAFLDPSGRRRRCRKAISAALWPVLFALVVVAAASGLAGLRPRAPAPLVLSSAHLPATPMERVQAALARGLDEAPPPTSDDFRFQTAQPVASNAASGAPYDVALQLQRGDTLDKLLGDNGVRPADRAAIAAALAPLLNKSRLVAGETVHLSLQAPPDAPDAPHVLSLLVRPQPEREYMLTRRDDGSYAGEVKTYKIHPRIVRVAARRDGSLMESGLRAGAPAQALHDFIKALSYSVDFQRELKAGQRFVLLLEQNVTSDGRIARTGRLLAGELELAKRTVTVIAYRALHGVRQFYTPEGNSVVRAFLRTPMDASHITSRFGFRHHPILGYSAMHAGVDFGAPTGTPILAAGNGRVAQAGRYGGYGVYVKLVHTPEIATAYGHMSRLGPGIRPGVPVRQGQVIGFVGSTGMSTGPHLHYEFHRHGRPVNPLVQRASLREHLAGRDLTAFKALVRQYVVKFKTAPLLGADDG